MKVDDIEVCKPITELVSFFTKNGFVILESKVSDYHFHEVFIKMKNNSAIELDNVSFEKISQPKPGVFCCSCHWSCIKIE
ncbi:MULTISPECIES: AraC family transcriptional regulator [Enterobacter]|jgi:hypothetical protein|uniref:AraC family transcriptional regulator n=1 Tax=Enterobacter TaxID=547 RepID=UPI001358B878|nr:MULTISPECIES: AraC family transcriptional regulator [Enterobacter]